MTRALLILTLLVISITANARTLDIYWIDVEGGAATLIVTPAGESVLIDSGNPGQRDPQRIVKVATEVARVRRIDHLITTHYHRDHFGGAPTLAKLMPIGIVHDNGEFDGMPDDPGKEYWNFPCMARKRINPGDTLQLKQVEGKTLRLRCLGTRKTFVDSGDGDQENAAVCGTHRPKDRDGSDNANSVAVLLEYEGFRFLDNGDLTWNQEYKLVCPKDLVGEVDVYQVTHHGLDSSNNPVVLNTVKPTVSVMNNGVTKGCLPEVFANLTACRSIQAMYQVHRNERPDGRVNNAPEEYIANRKALCDANYIRLSVAESGAEYTVSIPANNHARTFKTKFAGLNAGGSRTLDQARQDEQVLLWPEGAPNAKGKAPTDKPALTVHLPKGEGTGAAVIVNPGGGYRVLAADHEGLQVARELNRHGVTAFVLRYRLGPEYSVADSLLDAQRAIRYVRHHAERYSIDPNRIGMLGFSAGGHLASAAGTSFDAGDLSRSDPIERASSRPNFLALIYPAISGELFDREVSYPSTNKNVTSKTPPTFLAHTHEDSLTPNHSVAFYQALLSEGVPAELHVFGYGPHGTGLAPGDPDLGQWPSLFVRWMRRSGFMSPHQRVATAGRITVDGEPLYWGWLTLIPKDPNAPVVTSYLGWQDNGKFEIDAAHGPIPGRYTAQVRRVATNFTNKKAGVYSIHDVELFDELTVDINRDNHEDLAIDVTSN